MEDPECNGKQAHAKINPIFNLFIFNHPTLLYRNKTNLWNLQNRKSILFLLISGEALEEDDFDEEEEEDEEGKKIFWQKLFYFNDIIILFPKLVWNGILFRVFEMREKMF